MVRRLIACLLGSLALLTVTAVAIAAASGRPGSPFASTSADRAVARRQAPALLAALKLPAGAVASHAEPAGAGRALGRPGFALVGHEVVDAHAWYTIDASPSAVLAYVHAHLPHTLRIDGSGTGGERGAVTDAYWMFAPPAGLSELSAAVQTASLPNGRTAVRLDGEATWLVGRPGWDRVPAGVTSVRVTGRETPAGASRGRESAPRTLGRTDARRLAASIDALRRYQPGVAYSCPAATADPVLTLRFMSGARVRAIAVATPTGCASVSLTIGGRRGPALMDFGTQTHQTLDERLVAIGAIGPCRADQLSAAPALVGAQPGGPLLTFALRDRSDSICTLHGFPRVALRTARGRTLVARDHDQNPQAVRRDGLAAVAILYPGTGARFTVQARSCPGGAVATLAHVTLPGLTMPFAPEIRGTTHPLRPCAGRLRVSAFTAAP